MAFLLSAIIGICGLVYLVCFIMVVVKMFQTGQTGLGIACIVLIFCGIGGLVAFILGWMNAKAWGIQQLMMIWTVAFIGIFVGYGLFFFLVGGDIMQQLQNQAGG